MRNVSNLMIVLLVCLMAGCKITQIPSTDGFITSNSGLYDCDAGERCTIEIENGSVFSDSFTATANEGFTFAGWGNLCTGGDGIICEVFLPPEFTDVEFEGVLEPRFVPDAFSKSWLAGKAFYTVYFGSPNGQEDLPDVGIVDKLVFNNNGTVTIRDFNSDDVETIKYAVSKGRLHGADQSGEDGPEIACPGNGSHIVVHYFEGNQIENAERWFYNKNDAKKYAKALEDEVPLDC